MMMRWLKQNVPVIGFVLLLAFAWEASVVLFRVPHFIIPRLTNVFVSLWDTRELLIKHFAVTLWESVLGLLISVILGAALAIWIHFSRSAQKSVYPLVVASQTIPLIALSPVMVMWFGYEIWSKVAVVVLFTFFPITVNTIDGFRSADKDVEELMRAMGASGRDLFLKLQVPSALPSFFTGLKLAAAASVGGATIGEWLGAESGLGMYTRRASNMLRAEAVFAGVFLLSLMGILLFLAAKCLEHGMLRWQRNHKNN